MCPYFCFNVSDSLCVFLVYIHRVVFPLMIRKDCNVVLVALSLTTIFYNAPMQYLFRHYQ